MPDFQKYYIWWLTNITLVYRIITKVQFAIRINQLIRINFRDKFVHVRVTSGDKENKIQQKQLDVNIVIYKEIRYILNENLALLWVGIY